MCAEVLRDVLDEIAAAGMDEASRALVFAAMARVLRRRGVSWLERDEQIDFALQLLGMGELREIVRRRLMSAFGISKTTAYERINEALQLSGKQPFFRTHPVFNGNDKSDCPDEKGQT